MTQLRVVHAGIEYWFGDTGHWIRHRCLRFILDSTPILVKIQSFQTPALTWLMKFFSFLGSEEFFSPTILFMVWIVDVKFGVLFALLLAMCFYLASFFKNLLCLPRPPVPPAIVMVTENRDWAFPSNHGLVGTLIPFYTWIYAIMHVNMPFWVILFTGLVASLWSVCVCCSRVYLGVHNVADVVVSVLCSIPILTIICIFGDNWYTRWESDSIGLLTTLLYFVIFNLVHPHTNPKTESYSESLIVTSVAFGFILSVVWRQYYPCGNFALLSSGNYATSSWRLIFRTAAGRLIYGLLIVIGVHGALKPFNRLLCYRLYGLFGLPAYSFSRAAKANPGLLINKYHSNNFFLADPLTTSCEECKQMYKVYLKDNPNQPENGATTSRSDDRSEKVKRNISLWDIDIPSRIVTYTFMTFFVGAIAPRTFAFLGLEL